MAEYITINPIYSHSYPDKISDLPSQALYSTKHKRSFAGYIQNSNNIAVALVYDRLTVTRLLVVGELFKYDERAG